MMTDQELAEFVKSRDEMLVNFVETGSLTKAREHCEKYGVTMPGDEDVLRLGLLKAVQECTNISDEVKAKAAEKALRMGYSPFMFPWRHADDQN